MDDHHPWEMYKKDRLPSGFVYPVGRDGVEKALTASGARVDALYFSLPKLNPPNNPPIVIRIHWSGNSRPKYFDAKDVAANPFLIMWVDAVPSEDRTKIREQLEAGALSRVCHWIAELMSDPSSPTLFAEREFYLTWSGSELTESSTWPPTSPN